MTVRVWDAATGALLNTLEGESGVVISVSFNADSTKIVTGCDDKTVRVWDATTGALLNTLERYNRTAVT
ncbi:MAG: WD40 repeat domain-containing protein, partial [bacterium]